MFKKSIFHSEIRNTEKLLYIRKRPKTNRFRSFGGRRWIRTIEVDGRQIYSLLPLATRESFHMIANIGLAY